MKSNLRYSAALAAGFFAASTIQQENGVTFNFPVAGLGAHHMDTIDVAYESNFSQPLLYTFCGAAVQKSLVNVGAYNSSYLIKLDWDGSDTPCWFNLRPNSSSGFGANSESFDYDPAERSTPTTLALSTPTSATTSPSGTSSGSGSLPTSAGATTTSATEPTESSQASGSTEGLSTGAAAGIGVGIGVLGIGLGAALAIFCLRRRKRNRAAANASKETPNYQSLPPQGSPHPPKYPDSNYDQSVYSPATTADPYQHQTYSAQQQKYPAQPWPHEMDATHQPPVELSPESRVYELQSTPR